METTEEEEEVVALKCRPSRRGTAAKLDNGNALVLPEPQEEEDAPLPSKEILVHVAVAEEGGLSESQRSIYFDRDDGAELSNGTGEVKFADVGHSVPEKKLENGKSDFTANGADIQKSLTPGTNHQSHENLKDEGLSGLHLLLSEKSSENGTSSFRPVDKHLHLKVVKESKQEVAEWDVERVLDEQDTHDLYCPNCNSCITKRVILRKRKRKIQNLQYDTKREKIETVVQSSSLATNIDQGHNTIRLNLDGSPPASDISGRDHLTEPDLFRCLSCFSFFIPSVAGFKLFRIFGDRGEKGSVQSPQQIPDRNIAYTQGDDGIHDIVEDAIENLNSSQCLSYQQSDQVLSVIPVPSKSLIQPVNNAAVELWEDRKDSVVSSMLASVSPEEMRNDVEERPDGAIAKNSEAFADDKNVTIFSIPTTVPLLVESHANAQVKVSKGELQNDQPMVQVSSVQGSMHLVETRAEAKDKHKDARKILERGIDVMQDDSKVELLNPLPYMEKDLLHQNNDTISETPGAQLPKYYNTKREDGPKLEALKDERDIPIISKQEALPQNNCVGVGKNLEGSPKGTSAGKDVILVIRADRPEVSQSAQNNIDSSASGLLTYSEVDHCVADQRVDEGRIFREWDILKSIVYGGLIESITSLGIVSSAAGGDATTLNIIALGLASLVSGLFIIAHGLRDMKNEKFGGAADQNEKADRYQELLGQRSNFRLHATVSIISYLVFGLIPPVTYGFPFRKTDNKECKLIVAAAASLLCIILLAIAKAYVMKPPKAYIKTVLYFLSIGIMSSGLSYVIGMLIKKLLERVGWFEPSVAAPVPPSSTVLETMPMNPPWASY